MASSRKKEVWMEIAVGAFIALILIGLVLFTIIIGEQSLFKKYHEYSVFFDDVAGLRPNETVYSRGLMVGKVTDTEFVNMGDVQGVNVKLRLEHPLQLREGHRFEIKESSLLGGKRVVVTEGLKESPALQESAYSNLTGAPTGDLMGEATDMIQELRQVVTETEIIPNIERFTGELVVLATNVNYGDGTVAKLINDKSLYESAERITQSAERIAHNAEVAAFNVANGEGVLGELLSKDSDLSVSVKSAADNLGVTLANARSLTDDVRAGRGLAGDLFNDDSPLRANVLATTESVKQLASNLSSSEGTIGRLINDPALYDEALGTVRSITRTSDQIGGGVSAFTETARSITRTSDRIGGQVDTFAQTAKSITRTSDQVGQVVASVQRGEGTLGKIMTDPTLYNNATDLVDDVRATVDDLRETSPITTVGSLFFGAF